MQSFLWIFFFIPAALGFSPVPKTKKTPSTQLYLERRDLLHAGLVAWAAMSDPVQAHSSTWVFEDRNEINYEPAQMRQDGKFDLNSAFVSDYKYLRGMFPHAAGKIASNGPYKKISDIYRIEGLTENDIKLFKKYERQFIVNPPGRAFYERINAREST